MDREPGGQPETADRLFWQMAGDERLSAVLEEWLAAGSTEESFWSESSLHQSVWYGIGWRERQLWEEHISNPRSLVKLASNPFLLTMLFLVWLKEGELPKNRGELFDRFAICLLEREGLAYNGQPTFEGKQLMEGLSALAWRMQKNRVAAGQNEEGDFGVLTVVERRIAVETLSSEFLLKKALECTFLEGSDQLRFRHQLLQEYFSARALRSSLDETLASDLWPMDRWWERSGWEEIAVLLAGFFGDDCSQIIRWLARAQPEVAAQCILESGAELADRAGVLAELQAAWLPCLTDIEREPAPEGRAALGRALGRLGLDNRKGVGLRADGLPDIDWVEIPGGEFVYQEGERRREETFSIARYPVTNMQWQAFLDAKDGYADGRWWKGFTNPDRTPVAPVWSESNHPRESVGWYEAMAFCRWLAEKMKLDVQLPTEWQWERAAGGRDGRAYPWGNEYRPGYANIDESVGNAGEHYLARTSPVGIYPHGASPDDVLDLAGNVWEWCRNEYEHPERTQPRGRQSRVLRGGSWGYVRGYARAGARGGYHPDDRGDDVGFRVVVVSPIRNAGRRATEH